MNKDIKQLIGQATKQGWRVERTRNDHLKWIPPQGAFIISASTPSDSRAIKHITKSLEKAGFVSPKTRQKSKSEQILIA